MRLGTRVSVKALVEKFGAKPYGWPSIAVLCLTASLVARGKLEARADSSVCWKGICWCRGCATAMPLAIFCSLRRSSLPRPKIRKSRELFQALFDLPASGMTRAARGAEWQTQLRKMASDLEKESRAIAGYPFAAALDPLCERCSTACATSRRPGLLPARLGRKISCWMPRRISSTRSATSCPDRRRASTTRCALS